MYDIDYLTERREVLERIAKCCLREENVIPYLDDIEKEKKIHNIHDKGYKYLFSVKRNFIEFVKTFMKVQLNVELTEDNITLLDKEFITKEFDKQESDVIYEVKSNDKIIYFVLLELQSRVDRKMAYRILNYMVEIWRKWENNRNTEEKFVLPKIIPCVLYNGKDKWTAPIKLKGLYDEIGNEEEYLINFKYILIDIYRYKPEDLLELGSMISSVFYLDTSRNEDIEIRLKKLGKSIKKLSNEELTLFVDWMVNVFSINKDIKEKVGKILIKEEEEDMWNCARVMNELLNDKVNVGRVDTIKRLVSYKLNINLTPIQIELIDNASLDSLSKIEKRIFEINSWEEIEMLINNL